MTKPTRDSCLCAYDSGRDPDGRLAYMRIERGLLTVELMSGRGRLIGGLVEPSASFLGGTGGSQSASDGSGVASRKLWIYLVSATSRFSRISSRSSMRSASRVVSLQQVHVNTYNADDGSICVRTQQKTGTERQFPDRLSPRLPPELVAFAWNARCARC